MNADVYEGLYVAPANATTNATVQILCLVQQASSDYWWFQEVVIDRRSLQMPSADLVDDFVLTTEDALTYLEEGKFELVTDPASVQVIRHKFFPEEQSPRDQRSR